MPFQNNMHIYLCGMQSLNKLIISCIFFNAIKNINLIFFLPIMYSQQLQTLFLKHFTEAQHTLVPSSSIVPYSDPTLLFVNSGMVQFKQYFLSQNNLPYTQATSAQRCIRAGGKHNDLDDVGKDSYHHTFFIMLGNWSFGHYFKKEAIDYAWDFLVNVLKLDRSRIYVSYYASYDGSVPNIVDTETRDLWLRYLDKDRVLPFGAKENFWEMGDIGPCGPCTEIHYDSRENPVGGADFVNQDHPDVIEIWNIVFMEYYRNSDKTLSELQTKCIDTGMGMERVLRIVNGYKSNYLTDPFRTLIYAIEKVIVSNNNLINNINNISLNKNSNATKKNKGTESRVDFFDEDSDIIYKDQPFMIYTDTYDRNNSNFSYDMAMRVIADHSRTIAICLYDGVMFSSVGRGYVIRRIMRRAVKYCNFLEIANKMHVFIKLAGKTIGISLTHEMLKSVSAEESLFLKTLEKGKAWLNKKNNNELTGMEAFILYDTYGFPIDLTEIFCAERNITVNRNEFDLIMKKRSEENRKKRATAEEVISYNGVAKLKNYHRTVDGYKYTDNGIMSEVIAITRGDDIIYEINGCHDTPPKSLAFEDNIYYSLVSKETCFYSESGGQKCDRGTIKIFSNGMVIGNLDVYETMELDGLVFHLFRGNGILLRNFNYLECELTYNNEIRRKITNNHTGTHLLNHTLRKFIGNTIQMGSLVDENKLRFDFTCSHGLGLELLKSIEDYMNDVIMKNLPLVISLERTETVLRQEGIIYLAGEKYPEIVRVVTIEGLSSELCGGTHAKNTRDLLKIRIISEHGTSNNVRRIIAVTGEAAILCEQNLNEEKPLDYQIPLYDRICINNINMINEKQKIALSKKGLKSNIARIKHEIEQYKKTGSMNPNNFYYVEDCGFIFECDFQPDNNSVKHVNAVATILDQQYVDGFVYHMSPGTIIYAFRGENAKLRGEKFIQFIGNGSIKGQEKCCNGRAQIN